MTKALYFLCTSRIVCTYTLGSCKQFLCTIRKRMAENHKILKVRDSQMMTNKNISRPNCFSQQLNYEDLNLSNCQSLSHLDMHMSQGTCKPTCTDIHIHSFSIQFLQMTSTLTYIEGCLATSFYSCLSLCIYVCL